MATQSNESPKKEEFDMENFDWVALTKEIRASPETGKAYAETDWEKFQRKFGDNPLVPIGCLATTGSCTLVVTFFWWLCEPRNGGC